MWRRTTARLGSVLSDASSNSGMHRSLACSEMPIQVSGQVLSCELQPGEQPCADVGSSIDPRARVVVGAAVGVRADAGAGADYGADAGADFA